MFRADHSRCDREIQRLANQVSDLQEQLAKQQAAHVDQVSKLMEHYMGLATPENLQAFRYDPLKRAEQIKANSAQFQKKPPGNGGPRSPYSYSMHGPPKPDTSIEKAIKVHNVAEFDNN